MESNVKGYHIMKFIDINNPLWNSKSFKKLDSARKYLLSLIDINQSVRIGIDWYLYDNCHYLLTWEWDIK
jgi:hypothetical protein